MAVKIVRQPNKIAVLGAPTSAAAMSAGHEGAPSALRKAGLIEQLSSVGYQVADLGDDPKELYKPDEESPRARNITGVIRALEALKPRVEQAVKSAALPLILSGDCSVALATVAGARRYFHKISLIYVDRDADLNTPGTTPSGCIDGMVVSHLTGQGAAELVRFWPEPPLVREPDLTLFGVDRLDPSEEETLRRSPLRHYLADDVKRRGAAGAAKAALERIQSGGHEFILHFDVDVIADFQATNYPGTGGLTFEEVREALEVFVLQKNLAAIEVTAYNPTKDADGSGAKLVVDLLCDLLRKRFEGTRGVESAPAVESAPTSAAAQPKTEPKTEEAAPPPGQPGEVWSSDALEEEEKRPGEGENAADQRTGVSSDPVEDTREESPTNSTETDDSREKSPDSRGSGLPSA